MVACDVQGECPGGQQTGGEMGFLKPARQAKPLVDER